MIVEFSLGSWGKLFLYLALYILEGSRSTTQR